MPKLTIQKNEKDLLEQESHENTLENSFHLFFFLWSFQAIVTLECFFNRFSIIDIIKSFSLSYYGKHFLLYHTEFFVNTLCTPLQGLDENRGSSDFVHSIWIYYAIGMLQCSVKNSDFARETDFIVLVFFTVVCGL